MDHKDIMLSDNSQSQKAAYYMIPFHNDRHVENRPVDAQSWERGKDESRKG